MERVSEQAIFNSTTFRAEREEDWTRLEELLKRAEGGSVRKLSDDDLLELPVLYRSALSSLSVARETSLDMALIAYLEGLCTRAYFFVYGVRTSFGSASPASSPMTGRSPCAGCGARRSPLRC